MIGLQRFDLKRILLHTFDKASLIRLVILILVATYSFTIVLLLPKIKLIIILARKVWISSPSLRTTALRMYQIASAAIVLKTCFVRQCLNIS